MIRILCVAATAALLAGCGTATAEQESELTSQSNWESGMTEASDMMTAEANKTKLGHGVTGRHKQGTSGWYDQSGEDEGAPVDAPESGWGE
jgi:tetrahydromethanopterin S-methyltransferase subunit E